MKNFISLILVLCLLFTMVGVVFAETTQNTDYKLTYKEVNVKFSPVFYKQDYVTKYVEVSCEKGPANYKTEVMLNGEVCGVDTSKSFDKLVEYQIKVSNGNYIFKTVKDTLVLGDNVIELEIVSNAYKDEPSSQGKPPVVNETVVDTPINKTIEKGQFPPFFYH